MFAVSADPWHVHGADFHHAADRADSSSRSPSDRSGSTPIWFALIMLLALEISFTTPPFGLLLFVMKGVAPPDTTMREIYTSAAIPFIICSLDHGRTLLIAFPPLALWLPSLG
jgi:TRAP-type mannitol/chloroaromatic compound transport system permease large subunit